MRSVFLGTNKEIDWAFINGPKNFAPNLYQTFTESVCGKDLIDSYYNKIFKKIQNFIHGYGMTMKEFCLN